jgi:type III secretion protein J
VVVCVALLMVGCEAELHHGLDEQGANAMIVALEQHGLEAKKAPDPAGEGMWMVMVPEGAKVEALRVLEAEGLPRPAVKGFGELYPSGGLVPTAGEELVVLQYATAQELRGSLLRIDGVVDAHVNLVLPPRNKLLRPGEQAPAPRASVLVKYRMVAGQEGAPLKAEHVRELVAGGVQDMKREDVAVILTPAAQAARPLGAPVMARVGPVSVAPSSKRVLIALLGALVLVVLGLAGALGFVLMRRREARV